MRSHGCGGIGDGVIQRQAKVAEVDDTSLPDMDTKKKLNSEQAVEEPINSNFVDFWHEVNGETSANVDANFPEDVVYDWPEPKQIHNFYFVRVRLYEDTMLKAKLEEADEDIYWKNQFRLQIIEELREKRTERAKVISQLKQLTKEDKKYIADITDKRKEMGPLLAALGKLQNTNITAREKDMDLCSSEEELENLIRSLNYEVEHESHHLAVKKRFLEKIKQLEGTRDKFIANAKLKVEIQELLPQKEALENQVKIISSNIDVVRKDQQAVRMKIKHLEEELKSIIDEIAFMEEQLDIVSNKRDEAYKIYNDLRKSWDEANTLFYQNRSILNTANDLAAEKSIAALEKHSISEVEKFLSRYSSCRAFRDDYKRRILSSLDSRQLSRDGRMGNPDEEPITEQSLNEPETTTAKITAKQTEVTLDSPQPDSLLTHKVQDEIPKPTEDEILTPIKLEPKGNPGGTEKIDDTDEIGESKELPKPKEINAAKLKEMKREEEMAKAKLAMQRKQKLAEKAAAKMAAWAQKEAEKKIKEKEKQKQARKKAEMNEMDSKAEEPEDAESKMEASFPADTKENREKVRYRGRTKVPAPIPKAILKRKRSRSYWSWVADSAVILALVFLFYIAIN